MKPVVLITGSAGLIGSYLIRTAHRWAPNCQAYGFTREDADLLDHQAVTDLFRWLNPQAVIHCAALSRAGLCQDNPALARRINVEATERLAELARNIPFIFFSSDQVFDGTKGGYSESDRVNPLNVYGCTKAEGEQVVLQNERHSVIRLALTAGISLDGNRSFVEDMQRDCKAGRMLTLFTDEFRCPLPAGVIARAVWELVEHHRPGLYHLGGSERLSRWEIGQALSRRYPDLSPCLQMGSLATYAGPPRPADLSMRSEKLQNLLPFRLPGFREWLASRAQSVGDPWDYSAS
jgi:dTDP-4-dehydrorhamnose reductase